MESGKRERVMIACVTFETVKITDAIKHYNTEVNHLIHYSKEPSEGGKTIYQEFYDTVLEIIAKDNTDHETEIVEHNVNVNDFPTMMKTILGIMQTEYGRCPNADIYVNISAGSADYTAAATIVSMMFPESIPFSVGTKEYTIKDEDLKTNYYENEKPVGMTKTTYPPKAIPKINIDMPNETLVRGLRVLNELVMENKNVRAARIIKELKSKGLWQRDCDLENVSDRNTTRYDSVYYHRDFINKWIQNEWVYKDEFKNRYMLTDEGRRIISLFYLDEK